LNFTEIIRNAKEAADPGVIARAIPYGNFIGIDAHLDGDAVVCTIPGDEMIVGNPVLPAIHGGVIGAFLEHAALMLLMWELAPGQLPKTINVSIDYLRSGKLEKTFAQGKVTRQGRRVANVQAEAWQADSGMPIAVAHGHFLIMD
tara:strand:+ start:204 stop:638 length:435 start_codon:yes stop_codon:yes gene_type:complete